MSWFRSSRRRHSGEPPESPEGSIDQPQAAEEDEGAGEPAAVVTPAFAAGELQGKPLADLHRLAAQARVPRYRMLRREQLVAALGGEDAAPAPPAAPPRREAAPRPEPPRPRERVRPPRRAERQARRERSSTDDTLEDLERPVGRQRASFDDFPVQRPSRPLETGDTLAVRMVQIVAPLGHGQRALIAGPAGSGATALLQEVGGDLAGAGVRVHAVLVDVRPEEVPEWDGRVEVVAADSGTSPRDQVELAERALEQAKEAAIRGEDAVLLLDSLSRLARAYGLTRDTRSEAVEATKRWFAAARDGGAGRGSLTLIATARVETESSFDALVHDALEDSANMIVRLRPDLAARSKYPAIDADRSRTLGEDTLLDEDRRLSLENMRGVARSLSPEEAWDFLAERARELA